MLDPSNSLLGASFTAPSVLKIPPTTLAWLCENGPSIDIPSSVDSNLSLSCRICRVECSRAREKVDIGVEVHDIADKDGNASLDEHRHGRMSLIEKGDFFSFLSELLIIAGRVVAPG